MHKLISGPALIVAGLVMAILSAPRAAQANEDRILYSFLGGADGAQPAAGLTRDRKNGGYYGTTNFGGTSNFGTVFKITPDGTETVLHSFAGGSDGLAPQGEVIVDDDGNLYGATAYGGASNLGTVFKITPDGTETVLHSFAGGSDGESPNGNLTADDEGNFYGTTGAGGTGHCFGGCGTVFKITPDGQETVFYSFPGKSGGFLPSGGLLRDDAGNLYGTTSQGGANDVGTIFELTSAGRRTVLHSFEDGSDGAFPNGDLIADDEGNLYGTTSFGGASNLGTVFKRTHDGTVTVLHSFTEDPDGRYPAAGLVADAQGNLYGTTPSGGTSGLGTVFKVTSEGAESVLHSFVGGSDGIFPEAGLRIGRGGNLYGTALGGGANSQGIIFKVQN